jgi:hypothetical protein
LLVFYLQVHIMTWAQGRSSDLIYTYGLLYDAGRFVFIY